MPAGDEFELIFKTVERIPLIGPLWAEVFLLIYGIADAMNLQRLRTAPPRRVSRDHKLTFLY